VGGIPPASGPAHHTLEGCTYPTYIYIYGWMDNKEIIRDREERRERWSYIHLVN